MSFTINLYQFSKKPNSTARPAGIGTQYNGDLKFNSGIENPTILLKFDEPYNFNYMYIELFKRYYYINEWIWKDGYWELYCRRDVLATNKDYIGNSIQYILRSSSNYDLKVTDDLYPTFKVPAINTNYFPKIFTDDLEKGTYVIGCINGQAESIGGLCYYILTPDQFRNLKGRVFTGIDWTDIDFEGQTFTNSSLFRAQFNPLQYIQSCMWFPLTIQSSSTTVYLGYWDTGAPAMKMKHDPIIGGGQSRISIPLHPQAQQADDYHNLQPYSRHTVIFPPFPAVELDNTVISGGETLSIRVNNIDLITGMATARLYRLNEPGTNEREILRLSGQVGVSMSLSQISTNYLSSPVQGIAALSNQSGSFANFAAGALLGVGGLAIGDLIFNETAMPGEQSTLGNMMGSALGLIGNVTGKNLTAAAFTGAAGSIAAYGDIPVLISYFLDTVEKDINKTGLPLMKKRKISLIPGYIMCKDAALEIPGALDELNEVVAYMNGGFYYE